MGDPGIAFLPWMDFINWSYLAGWQSLQVSEPTNPESPFALFRAIGTRPRIRNMDKKNRTLLDISPPPLFLPYLKIFLFGLRV
jgi:hypothetical protein